MRRIEKEQFCDLIRAQEVSMYRYALGILRHPADAEDAVGETILKAYSHLDQLKRPDRFRSWIMSILANEVRNLLAQKQRIELSEDMNQYEQTIQEEDRELWRLVMGMPLEFRDVVILYYYEGFTTREIGTLLEIPEGTVKSRLNRARGKLRQLLEEA